MAILRWHVTRARVASSSVLALVSSFSLLLLAPTVGAESPGSRPTAHPAARSQPPRQTHFDLTRLTDMWRLPTREATRRYLSFVREETTHPSPTLTGPFGGGINHAYILAQIIMAGVEARVDQATLRRVAKAEPTSELGQVVRLTLGLRGDRTVLPFLLGYLSKQENPPELRQQAIEALVRLPDRRALPVLVKALDDPFNTPSGDVGPPRRSYPIRISARRALLALQKAGTPLSPQVRQRLHTLVTVTPVSSPLPSE